MTATTYDKAAIMRAAWAHARAFAASCWPARRPREVLATWLRHAWHEARQTVTAARHLARYTAAREAASARFAVSPDLQAEAARLTAAALAHEGRNHWTPADYAHADRLQADLIRLRAA